MQLISFFWKLILRTFALICFLLTSYLGIGHFLGTQIVNVNFEPDPNGIEIYVLSNGVHTDIAVPVVTDQIDWTQTFDPRTFQPEVPIGTTPQYIAFGWGDKRLYDEVPTWGDLTVPIFINAMFIPSESAMHLSYFINKPKTSAYSIPVKISPEQYQMLIDQFIGSFKLYDGAPRSLNCCFYPNLRDQFYASNRSYHALFTCNMWTNKMLKTAGIPTAQWASKQDYIMQHLVDKDLTGE